MQTSSIRTKAFTLVELMVASATFAIFSVGVMTYASAAVRMAARNLATNHSHEAARGSLERLLSEVHKSASRFQLINFNGTSYTDVNETVSSDRDAYTQQYVSARANGVRFMRLAGGPYKLTGNGTSSTIATTDTTLEFDFNGSSYTPRVGDKVQIPLLTREFDIVAPAPTHTSSGKWVVTLSSAVGFSIITNSGTTNSGVELTDPVIVGLFFQRVGYTVLNNQLRFHPHLTNPPYPATIASDDVPTVIRRNVTSPKPFGLLFPSASGSLSDATNLRVSLESYDTQYSARLFQNGTTTLQAVIPSRNQPSILGSN